MYWFAGLIDSKWLIRRQFRLDVIKYISNEFQHKNKSLSQFYKLMFTMTSNQCKISRFIHHTTSSLALPEPISNYGYLTLSIVEPRLLLIV